MMTKGSKMASDPIFNMVAQLVAAELNRAAGAGICGKAATAITQANASWYPSTSMKWAPALSNSSNG